MSDITTAPKLTSPKTQQMNQRGYGMIGSLVSLVFGIILGILAFRLVFRLLGANPDNGLVQWIYSASAPLVSPFYGIFNHDINVVTGRFEFETFIAIIVYGVIASLVVGVFSWGSHRPHSV